MSVFVLCVCVCVCFLIKIKTLVSVEGADRALHASMTRERTFLQTSCSGIMTLREVFWHVQSCHENPDWVKAKVAILNKIFFFCVFGKLIVVDVGGAGQGGSD